MSRKPTAWPADLVTAWIATRSESYVTLVEGALNAARLDGITEPISIPLYGRYEMCVGGPARHHAVAYSSLPQEWHAALEELRSSGLQQPEPGFYRKKDVLNKWPCGDWNIWQAAAWWVTQDPFVVDRAAHARHYQDENGMWRFFIDLCVVTQEEFPNAADFDLQNPEQAGELLQRFMATRAGAVVHSYAYPIARDVLAHKMLAAAVEIEAINKYRMPNGGFSSDALRRDRPRARGRKWSREDDAIVARMGWTLLYNDPVSRAELAALSAWGPIGGLDPTDRRFRRLLKRGLEWVSSNLMIWESEGLNRDAVDLARRRLAGWSNAVDMYGIKSELSP